MQKYAAFEVLDADLARGGNAVIQRATDAILRSVAQRPRRHLASVKRVGHRHAFKYEPRPGFLYVRSRAISSRCNDNFDEFPAEEIKKAYATFVGKPVFVNHKNDNHRRARGVIIDAALHEDTNPDGSPDTWCEVLMEVDAVHFPKLAQAILAGEIDRTSMGTDVAFSVCSYCGNRAATPLEYCAHIPRLKGQRIYRHNASTGQREGVLVREICYGLGFFENSLLVEEPADPTAFFLGVEGGPGIEIAASRIDAEAVTAEALRILAEPATPIQRTASGGVHYLILPNDPQAAHEAMRRHIEQHHPEHAVEAKSGQWNRQMLHTLTSTGGFSVHDHLGDAPKNGYMVSDEGAEKAEPIREVYNHPERIEGYYHAHQDAVRDPQAYIGAWAHKSNVFFDVSRHYDDEAQAQAAARKNHQLAYYDLGSGTSKMIPNSGHTSKTAAAFLTDWNLAKLAYGETLAPADVDTLRDEMCPVCGEEDSYDGERCLVCGFVKPPDVFMDPDLDAAKANDLRQDADDERLPGAGDLVCPACGDTFQSPAEGGQPVALEAFVPPDQEGDEQQAAEAPGATQSDPAVATDPTQTFDNALPKNKPAPTDDQTGNTDADPETAPKEGDDCPTCGKGQLQHKDAPTPPAAQADDTPPKKDGDDDKDPKDGDDDKDGKDKKKSVPPWMKDKKKSHLAAPAASQKEESMRPALAALAEQQRQINALRQGFSTIASLAGLDQHPVVVATMRDTDPTRVAAILKQADEMNPAQPIPDPAAEAPAATTQETRAPDATDDPNNLGASPLTDVAPDATTTPTQVGGTVLDEPLDLNEQNVTAPVAGTEDLGEGARGQAGTNRTETDVQVGNPNNPAVPFAETGWTTGAQTGGRTWASLRLARLRIQAGVEDGDDLMVGQGIDNGQMTDEAIQGEIETLSKVIQANAARQVRPADAPRHLVPRAAARTAPSLAPTGSEEPFVPPMQTVASGPSDEEFAFE